MAMPDYYVMDKAKLKRKMIALMTEEVRRLRHEKSKAQPVCDNWRTVSIIDERLGQAERKLRDTKRELEQLLKQDAGIE